MGRGRLPLRMRSGNKGTGNEVKDGSSIGHIDYGE